MPVAVRLARMRQQLEPAIVDLERIAAQRMRERRSPATVHLVAAVVLPATVVEEGEELDDVSPGAGASGNGKAVQADAGPVGDAVDAILVQGEAGADGKE